MKHKFFYFKTLLLSTILAASLLSGCGSDTNNINGVSDTNIGDDNRNLPEQIAEILGKDTLSTDDLSRAYTLVTKLEKEDEQQAKDYLYDLKYCMYEKDAYNLADDVWIWSHTPEEAEETIKNNYYGTWYDSETDKVIKFTSETIGGRAYFVRSVYTDYSIMVIYGYFDAPEKLYCLEMDSQYYEYTNGNGDLIHCVKYSKDYVPGLTYEKTSWYNFDSLTREGIINAYNEYVQEGTYGTSALPIYEEMINKTVVPSYDGSDTTEIVGDGNYFDEIVSGAWFDENGEPIAACLPTDLTEAFFYSGYYVLLKNLHFIDGSEMGLDYVKRYGYSTDAFLDEIYALILTDVYKREDSKGNKFFEGIEYFSGETVIIQGSFNGLMNGDSVMVIGPLHGLGSDDTANFTGIWCELINDRISGYEDTGYLEWSDTAYEDYGTYDVFDGYETEVYEICDYLYGTKGSPEDFFKDVGLTCYTQIGADGVTCISVSEYDYSVLFRLYENLEETEYACNIKSGIEGIDSSNLRIAGFNLYMSYNEVLQMLEDKNWTYCIEDDLIKAEQGDCELFITFYQGSIFGIDYFEKAGYWYENGGI